MLRLYLVRHAGTAATGSAVVPHDEPAVEASPDLTTWLGRAGSVITSPAQRCRVDGARVEPLLAPWDLGDWAGKPFDELDLAAWRSDPAYDAHGGESPLALFARVARMLAALHDADGRLVAVTHAAVVKAREPIALPRHRADGSRSPWSPAR